MSSPSLWTSRRSRQANALELFEDLAHELTEVWHGSSPATAAFRTNALERMDSLKRNFPEITHVGPNTPASKKLCLATPRAPPHINDAPTASAVPATATSNPHATPPTNPHTATAAVPGQVTPANAGAPVVNEVTPPTNAQPGPSTSQDITQKTKPKPAAARAKRVQDRFEDLLHHINEEPASKEDFIRNIENPGGGERKEQEDRALGRILMGWGAEGCHKEWKPFLTDKFSTVDVSWIADELVGIEQRANMTGPARMQATHLALEDTEECTNKRRYIEFVLARASTKKKQAFYESTYQNLPQHKDHFAALSEEERADAMNNSHAEGYAVWRKKIEPRITARNRFVDLYVAVQYGPLVFLDPFWDVRTLTDGARTKDFPNLLHHFIENVPMEPAQPGVTVAAARWRGSCDAMAGVARAIDSRVFKCMKALFASNPDNVIEE
ncbi:hypothetical protein C8F04DRAFT_1261165 [Mycena alexandri]|uniref:Uncharacterized protein n=1 Tax=Mycena alexandri TaxID=1745969 RepID=A0AAD6SSH0_9AGAR|nr:hypothetical protein C8F04DRAFT_1261165 [Mycena alexandri]